MIALVVSSLYTHRILMLIMIKVQKPKGEKHLSREVTHRTWFIQIQASFCGSVSNAETVFSNLILWRGAPLCLIAQAVLSSSGQRAFNMENTWLFNLLAFFITSNSPSHPCYHIKKLIKTKTKYACKENWQAKLKHLSYIYIYIRVLILGES